jgi:hypothetical protein
VRVSPSQRVPAFVVAVLLGTVGLFSFAAVALPGLV